MFTGEVSGPLKSKGGRLMWPLYQVRLAFHWGVERGREKGKEGTKREKTKKWEICSNNILNTNYISTFQKPCYGEEIHTSRTQKPPSLH